MRRVNIYKLLFCLIFPFSVHSQLSISFAPAIFGQSIEGLSQVQLISAFPHDIRGKITIIVRQISGPEILIVKSPSFTIRPGAQTIDPVAFNNANFRFYNNSTSNLLSQTRRFPEGEFEYCFEVDISESKPDQLPSIYESCFEHQLQPQTPLLLMDPIDEDEICNKRPTLTWQPPMPLSRNSRFRVILSEVKDKQEAIESITYNTPVVLQTNIPGNTLPYPSNAPELAEGKTYAWQVTLYEGKAILKKSEIWTFRIKCDEPVVASSGEGYRELKEVADGNYYVATRFLRFSLSNPYGDGPLHYSITSMSEPDKHIKGLPELRIYPGLNTYEIDLDDRKSFIDGREYKITVRLVDNRQLTLRFKFKKGIE